MSLFRALNLLQGIESGTVDGTALEAILSPSLARKAEFGALLSTRHNARRMAGNSLTMNVISASESAIEIVFEKTTVYNFRPMEQIAAHQASMLSTSTHLSSLETVIDNDVAWALYNTSSYYEANIVNTLSTLLGIDPTGFANIGEMITDSATFGNIATNTRAMKALVASTPAMTIVVTNGAAMADIATDNNAMTIVANNDAAVHLIALSQTALDEITESARVIVLGIPSALAIFASHDDAWLFILQTSTTLSSNIYTLLLALAGLDHDVFETIDDIFADTTASFAVANSKPAMVAIIEEKADAEAGSIPSAFSKLLTSNNLGTVLGSLVAIDLIVADEAIMDGLITIPSAFSILLTSSAAKAAIFASTTLVTTMLTSGSDSLATVQGLAQSVTVVNDALIGTFKTVGVSGKIIILTGVMGSIVATTLDNTFRSGDDAGTEVTFAIPGTSLSSGPVDILLPFTDAKVDVNSIAATSAGSVIITLVDFN
jgi:hypothetical protein